MAELILTSWPQKRATGVVFYSEEQFHSFERFENQKAIHPSIE
jgi:hypothetical protein